MSNMKKGFKNKSALRCMADGGIFRSEVNGVPTFSDAHYAQAGAVPYVPKALRDPRNTGIVQGGMPLPAADPNSFVGPPAPAPAPAPVAKAPAASPLPPSAPQSPYQKLVGSVTEGYPAPRPVVASAPSPLRGGSFGGAPTVPVAPPSAPQSPYQKLVGSVAEGYPASRSPRRFSSTPAVEFASGGPVRGPGGPTEDKVPALLSDGEYVLPADTVDAVGKENLDALRDATHEPVRKGKSRSPLRKMADGDLVTLTKKELAFRGGELMPRAPGTGVVHSPIPWEFVPNTPKLAGPPQPARLPAPTAAAQLGGPAPARLPAPTAAAQLGGPAPAATVPPASAPTAAPKAPGRIGYTPAERLGPADIERVWKARVDAHDAAAAARSATPAVETASRAAGLGSQVLRAGGKALPYVAPAMQFAAQLGGPAEARVPVNGYGSEVPSADSLPLKQTAFAAPTPEAYDGSFLGSIKSGLTGTAATLRNTSTSDKLESLVDPGNLMAFGPAAGGAAKSLRSMFGGVGGLQAATVAGQAVNTATTPDPIASRIPRDSAGITKPNAGDASADNPDNPDAPPMPGPRQYNQLPDRMPVSEAIGGVRDPRFAEKIFKRDNPNYKGDPKLQAATEYYGRGTPDGTKGYVPEPYVSPLRGGGGGGGGSINSNAGSINRYYDKMEKDLSRLYSDKGKGNLAKQLVALAGQRAAALEGDQRNLSGVTNTNTNSRTSAANVAMQTAAQGQQTAAYSAKAAADRAAEMEKSALSAAAKMMELGIANDERNWKRANESDEAFFKRLERLYGPEGEEKVAAAYQAALANQDPNQTMDQAALRAGPQAALLADLNESQGDGLFGWSGKGGQTMTPQFNEDSGLYDTGFTDIATQMDKGQGVASQLSRHLLPRDDTSFDFQSEYGKQMSAFYGDLSPAGRMEYDRRMAEIDLRKKKPTK